MKIVLTTMLLGFLVLSCKKEKEVSNDSTADSTMTSDNMTMAPEMSDTIRPVDSIPAPRADTTATAKTSK